MKVVSRVALVVTVLAGCSRAEEPRYARRMSEVPPELAMLAADALRAATDIKVTGDVEAVLLRERPRSARYEAAMRGHFELMRELHRVGQQSHVRYLRPDVSVRHDQFCADATTAYLVMAARVRYDMEALAPNSGTPPYTASEEEHVFRFERRNGSWMMTSHHEITLAERKQRELVMRLRNPCRSA